MKVLFFYNATGNLGDAIRVNKIRNFIERRASVIDCNLYDYYSSKLKLAFHPEVISEVIKYALTFKPMAYTQTLAFVKLGRRIIKDIIEKNVPDFIFAEGTLLGYIAIEASREFGIPLIVDIHGIKAAEYIENNNTRDIYYDFLVRMEQEVFKESDYLLSVSNYMNRYISETYGAKESKIILIPNGSEVRKKVAHFNPRLRVIYGGIFAFWEDVDSYLDLAKEASKKYKFYIMGRGPEEKHIKRRIKAENIEIVDLGYREREESLEIFSEMQVGIAPSSSGITRKVACPIKVFDYLACGLPVITPDFGEWAEIIHKHKCGMVTKRSDASEFFDALSRLSDINTWQEMSNNAVELIKKKYNWEILLKPLEDIIKK
jgi:glycosyltransferase involved in cell wall biosynthesis